MGRVARQRLGRGIYHVYNRALDGRCILADDATREFMLALLARFAATETLTVYHWALMANHFHLAVEVLEPVALSRWIGKVQRRMALYCHRRNGGMGPVWQGRYRSILVEKAAYLGRLGRYIERNGLRAGVAGVERPWDYRWCSAGCYVFGTPDCLVAPSCHPWWHEMGTDDAARREAYARHLLLDQEATEDEIVFREPALVVGGARFRAQVARQHGRLTARKTGRPRQEV